MWKFLPISLPAFISETLLMNMMSIGIKYNTKVAGIGKFFIYQKFHLYGNYQQT